MCWRDSWKCVRWFVCLLRPFFPCSFCAGFWLSMQTNQRMLAMVKPTTITESQIHTFSANIKYRYQFIPLHDFFSQFAFIVLFIRAGLCSGLPSASTVNVEEPHHLRHIQRISYLPRKRAHQYHGGFILIPLSYVFMRLKVNFMLQQALRIGMAFSAK